MNEFVCKLNFTEEEKEQLKRMGFSLALNHESHDMAYMRFEVEHNCFELILNPNFEPSGSVILNYSIIDTYEFSRTLYELSGDFEECINVGVVYSVLMQLMQVKLIWFDEAFEG